MKLMEKLNRLKTAARSGHATARRELVRALADKSAKVRWVAIQQLAALNDRAAAQKIAALLDDANIEVRYNAADALGALLTGTRKAPRRLVRLLSDKDALVRVQAIDALEAIRDKRALHAVLAALSDKNRLVRGHAAAAVASLGKRRHRAKLTAHLVNEQNPWAEVGFLDSLYRLGDRTVFTRLIAKLTADSYHVRAAAANALADMKLTKRAHHTAVSALRKAKRHSIDAADAEAVTRAPSFLTRQEKDRPSQAG
jgi:HEAT repeat protein